MKKPHQFFGKKTLSSRASETIRQDYIDVCADLGDTIFGLQSLDKKRMDLEAKQIQLRLELIHAEDNEARARAKEKAKNPPTEAKMPLSKDPVKLETAQALDEGCGSDQPLPEAQNAVQ